MSIWSGILSGPNSPAYFEHEGGPLVIRGRGGVSPQSMALAVREIEAAFAALAVSGDGLCQSEESRCERAGTYAAEAFMVCDAYAADAAAFGV